MEPKIIAFCCHYCAFTAADLAGTMRQQYPTNIHIVRLPCTGKVDVNMLLEAFVEGADGVMVAGCEVGSCHFLEGNVRAKKRVDYAKKKLEEVGIDPQKLEMYHIAASEGPLFAQTAREFTDRIIQLQGNNGIQENVDQKHGTADTSYIPPETPIQDPTQQEQK